MSDIYNLPDNPPSYAGLEFNYAVWSPGTVATFCNVNWNSDYRDVPIFDDGQAGLNAFIDAEGSSSISITEMTYVRPGQPIRVSVPLGAMMNYNYVRVFNPGQPVPGSDVSRYWYYFITDVRHVAPNTTEIHVQLDVMQSFVYDIQFGRCYVEAGHVGVANENQFKDYGRSYLTVPEGFDLGSEYQIDYVAGVVDGSVTTAAGGPNYQIVVLTTVDLDKSGGSTENPELATAPATYAQGLPLGAGLYTGSITSFINFMQDTQDKPWITQGILGVWAFPSSYEIPRGEAIGNGMYRVGSDKAEPVEHEIPEIEEWREKEWAIRNRRYRHLKKFLTYPYSFWEMTTYTGTPLILKPESWQSGDGVVVAIPHWSPPGMRITYFPRDYNRGAEPGREWGDITNPFAKKLPINGEFLDMATVITDLPSFPVVNNSYMSYLASNRHSIAFQHQSADWSQQRAMAGNQVAYGQATAGMDLQRQQTDLSIATANAQNTVQNNAQIASTAIGAAGSIIGGAMAGPAGLAMGAGNALMSGANAVVDINARNQSLAINNNAQRRSTDLNVNTAAYMRDTNKSYADYAAQGDYRNAIAAINAKVQDAKMIQPTTSGQLGGDANLLANYKWGFDLKWKTLTDSAMTMIGEHWLRYGYAVNRYYSPGFAEGLHCMTRFTYWKMLECTIVHGPIPETFKQAIRGILEKGVTIWRNPIEIGSLDPAVNRPLEGIEL